MKQILQNLKTGSTELAEVPAPACKDGHLLICTRKSLISAGTERMLVDFGKAGIIEKIRQQPDKVRQVLDKIRTDGFFPTLEAVRNKLDQPMPLGYCNVGVVQRSKVQGSRFDGFDEGDRVVSNGPHAEVVCVPHHLCAKIPDNVSDEEAAFTVLGAIGLQGIRLANPTFGEKFVVYGAGLIGLLTVQLLRGCGCEVMAVDLNDRRLALAESFGARVCNPGTADPVAAAKVWTNGIGMDGVIITASAKTDEIVHLSAEMCRKRGRIVLVGVVGLSLRRADFYEKELSIQVSCSYGPGRYDANYEQKGEDYPVGFVRWTEQRNFEAVLGAMASGTLDVAPLITHRFGFEAAGKAYDAMTQEASLGIILEYPEECPAGRTVSFGTGLSAAASPCVAAMIGAGNFAKMTLAPALSKTGARLKYVAARASGADAAHIARKYGFEKATTDLEEVLGDPEVNTVFITTRHDSHASLLCRALSAGKHVFVEKPLCLNVEELQKISTDFADSTDKGDAPTSDLRPRTSDPRFLMVGFNRRFSPHVQKIKALLAGRSEPLAMHYACNAGIISPEVWVHDPAVGGGRIIGEACHFIDLLSYIAGSPVRTVSAVQMGSGAAIRGDKMSIALGFEDGSIGTVNYFGNGNKRYPKEMMEIYSEGRILKLENFRKTEGVGFSGFGTFKTFSMDKGHGAEVKAFVDRVCSGGEPLMGMDAMVNATLASFAAVTSAEEGRTIHLDQEYANKLGLTS